MKRWIIVSIVMYVSVSAHAQITGYSFGREIVIQGSQVSGSLSNFPVLISISHADLRHTSNGGHVQNANGYDIVFSSGCTTALPHQIERYTSTGTTGTLVAWVQVPLLNAGVNTTIYMYYGKTGITVNPSTDNVWDANYVGVYHLSNENFTDASGTGNNGINSGTNNVTNAKIAGGRNFDPTGEYIQLPTSGWSANSGTVSVWGSSDAFTGNHQYFFGHTSQPSFNNRIQIYTDDSNGYLDVGLGNSHALAGGNIFDLNTGQWYYIVLTWNAGNYAAYVNGNSVASGTYAPLTEIGTLADIGNQGEPAMRNESFDGQLDEVRISNVSRSANWILTEYRNQNSPSTFYSVSAELTADVTCALPVELLLFEAIADNRKVKLIWSTANESNNKDFTIERSKDGENWEEAFTIEGTGNSNNKMNYSQWDHYPLNGVSYYRLKQTDYDGKFTYSWTRKVDIESGFIFKVYPNPSKGEFIVEMEEPEKASVNLFNSLGQPVSTTQTIISGSIIVSVPYNNKGVYHLQVDNGKDVKRHLLIFE